MEYITKNCPKCNGELRIPENLKTCICMYCGEKIDLQDKEQSAEKNNNQGLNYKEAEAEYKKSLEMLHKMLEVYEECMKQFSRKNYESCFEEYVGLGKAILEPAEKYYLLTSQDEGKIVTEVTDAIIDSVKKIIFDKPKIKQKEALMQFRFFLTCYTVPMIRFLKFTISEPLAESIVVTWNKQNPKDAFQKADYDQLAKGFIRKGLCFITTAVCETMNKEDDCYELTAFRNFRDNYMLQSKEGRELVEEYYQVAPAIVTLINLEPDRNEKYMEIWQKYLKDCLKDIETKRLSSCEKRYTRMVQSLKREYYVK